MKHATSKPKSPAAARRAAHTPQPAAGDGFAQHAEKVFERMQEAMTRLIEALPEPVQRAVDLQRALGVYAPLAWRVFRIAGADEPLQVAEYVPTPGHVATLLEAAHKKGVPQRIVAEVRDSMAAYEDLRKSHAGSREKLRSMVASLRPAETDLIDEKCRRIAFEQNSLIWGVQTDVGLGCTIINAHPEKPSRIAVGISGRVGFHAVRPGASKNFIMAGSGDTAAVDAQTVDRHISTDSDILREFCSPSLAATRSWQGDDRWANTKIAQSGIGRRSAVNYFQVFCNEQGAQEPLELDVGTTIPAMLAHVDLLVPAAWKAVLSPARVFGYSRDMNAAYLHRASDRIPVEVTAVHLGAMTNIPAAAGIPRYQEIVRKVLESRGWYGTEFDVFRCRTAYPIMHTVIHVGVKIGDSESGESA